jgi:hypothetical protein
MFIDSRGRIEKKLRRSDIARAYHMSLLKELDAGLMR